MAETTDGPLREVCAGYAGCAVGALDYRLCAQLVKLAEFVGEVFPYGIQDAGGRLVQVVDAQLLDGVGQGIGGVGEIRWCRGICGEPLA